ncbi:PREDICTED: uncharacterized protein LOC104808615 [Tarenaya hassleriana]|uniref:uncharacterized protein LOC104808615 n=1 Tax=Tarenaya hassleriana TaxID=28532 RepID=UPI00053C2B3D|nr:PREDICTED: uncharacterized protein LOC104808615 [Tarenaya hassleriana]
MDKVTKPVYKFGKKIEKFPYVIDLGRVVFAAAFIVSAWQEFRGFDGNGGSAAEQFRPKLGFLANQAKYLVGIGIGMKAIGGIMFIFSTYLGAFILLVYQALVSPILYDFYNHEYDKEQFNMFYTRFQEFVNETVSADGGVATNFYNVVVNDESRQKFCDQLNEIARLAISNPLFTPSDFNAAFMKFTRGVGIVGALMIFVAMKHKYDEVYKSSKQKN